MILLDIMLPKLDGFEVCRELRRRRNKTPIILLTAEGPPAPDPRIALWSLPDLQLIAELRTPPERTIGMIDAVTVTPDGSTLVASSVLGVVAWSLSDRRPTPLAGDGVRKLAVTPDGKILVGGSAGGRIGRWSLTDGRQTAAATGHSGSIDALAVSADGRIAASGSNDSTARLWSVPDGRPVAELKGHKGIVSFVQFTPDGGTLDHWSEVGLGVDGDGYDSRKHDDAEDQSRRGHCTVEREPSGISTLSVEVRTGASQRRRAGGVCEVLWH